MVSWLRQLREKKKGDRFKPIFVDFIFSITSLSLLRNVEQFEPLIVVLHYSHVLVAVTARKKKEFSHVKEELFLTIVTA